MAAEGAGLPPPNLVVVSHYDAWPMDQLLALLDQMATIAAGAPFDVCIVVNQCGSKMLHLPVRHAHVQVLHRPNGGYNIGAWDHGWRRLSGYDNYLFVQEECRILRPGWLAVFTRLLANPRVGAVGESLAWAGLSWKQVDRKYRDFMFADPVEGKSVPVPVGVRAGLERLGVSIGTTGSHLQSLVVAIRREVLEATDGFVIARTYGEATVAEVAVTKQIEALGLIVREIGPGSFRYILHPQWAFRRGVAKALLRRLARHVPVRISEWMRARVVRRRVG